MIRLIGCVLLLGALLTPVAQAHCGCEQGPPPPPPREQAHRRPPPPPPPAVVLVVSERGITVEVNGPIVIGVGTHGRRGPKR